MAEEVSESGVKSGSKTTIGGKKKNAAKDYKNLTGRQKAAIFLVSLGSEVSAEVMKQIGRAHV